MAKRKIKVVLSKDVKEFVKDLNEEDKKIFEGAVERVRRNPYVGDEIGAGPLRKMRNKLLWIKREIELRFGKYE